MSQDKKHAVNPAINPLVTDPIYLVCMAKISILK